VHITTARTQLRFVAEYIALSAVFPGATALTLRSHLLETLLVPILIRQQPISASSLLPLLDGVVSYTLKHTHTHTHTQTHIHTHTHTYIYTHTHKHTHTHTLTHTHTHTHTRKKETPLDAARRLLELATVLNEPIAKGIGADAIAPSQVRLYDLLVTLLWHSHELILRSCRSAFTTSSSRPALASPLSRGTSFPLRCCAISRTRLELVLLVLLGMWVIN
jgi:hypothetical protein